MAGANPEHTRAVTAAIRLPLRPWFRLKPVDLGVEPGLNARLHPRVIAHGLLLVEVDGPHAISLAAVDLRRGRLAWRKSFPTPRLFDDAGMFPAAEGDAAALFVAQGRGQQESQAWNLSRIRLSDGQIEWETGTARLWSVHGAGAGTSTLFRPVVAAGGLFLVVPDFFGRPPLVAFRSRSGMVAWHSSVYAADQPLVDERGGLAISAGLVGGHLLLQTVRLADGTLVTRHVDAAGPSGVAEDAWDPEPVWVDQTAGYCCAALWPLQEKTTGMALVLPLPGESTEGGWQGSGAGSCAGPVGMGSVFTAESPAGERVLSRRSVVDGKAAWQLENDQAGEPLALASNVLLVRQQGSILAARAAATGRLLWRTVVPGFTDCIVGDGVVAVSGVMRGNGYLALFR